MEPSCPPVEGYPANPWSMEQNPSKPQRTSVFMMSYMLA